MALTRMRPDWGPADGGEEEPAAAINPRLKPRHKESLALAAFPERPSRAERRPMALRPSAWSPPAPPPGNVHERQPSRPRLTARIWAVLVWGALAPFGWFSRCRCCWRGRCRTVIGQHHSHLRVLRVCRVCDAARPVAAWLQPSERRGK